MFVCCSGVCRAHQRDSETRCTKTHADTRRDWWWWWWWCTAGVCWRASSALHGARKAQQWLTAVWWNLPSAPTTTQCLPWQRHSPNTPTDSDKSPNVFNVLNTSKSTLSPADLWLITTLALREYENKHKNINSNSCDSPCGARWTAVTALLIFRWWPWHTVGISVRQ